MRSLEAVWCASTLLRAYKIALCQISCHNLSVLFCENINLQKYLQKIHSNRTHECYTETKMGMCINSFTHTLSMILCLSLYICT
jgi:hypothetical protein